MLKDVEEWYDRVLLNLKPSANFVPLCDVPACNKAQTRPLRGVTALDINRQDRCRRDGALPQTAFSGSLKTSIRSNRCAYLPYSFNEEAPIMTSDQQQPPSFNVSSP